MIKVYPYKGGVLDIFSEITNMQIQDKNWSQFSL